VLSKLEHTETESAAFTSLSTGTPSAWHNEHNGSITGSRMNTNIRICLIFVSEKDIYFFSDANPLKLISEERMQKMTLLLQVAEARSRLQNKTAARAPNYSPPRR
jgi:hypothetical protein